MERNERIIILLLCVIVIVLLVGVLVFSQAANKDECRLRVSDSSIYAGDALTLKLTDLNGTPITDENVDLRISKGEETSEMSDVSTNSKGVAKVKLNETGSYYVECSFDGNDKFKAASVNANVSVKDAKTSSVGEHKTSNYDSVSGLSDDGYSYYPEYGPAVDHLGTSRETAIAKNMHYIPMTIDGMDVGTYVAYDPVNKCYHT